jgi:hypothetical protein
MSAQGFPQNTREKLAAELNAEAKRRLADAGSCQRTRDRLPVGTTRKVERPQLHKDT